MNLYPGRFTQQQVLLSDIKDALNEMVSGIIHDEEFYRNLLDHMVVHDKDHVDVHINFLPFKWSYAIAKALEKGGSEKRHISDTSVPTNVSKMFQNIKIPDKPFNDGLWVLRYGQMTESSDTVNSINFNIMSS